MEENGKWKMGLSATSANWNIEINDCIWTWYQIAVPAIALNNFTTGSLDSKARKRNFHLDFASQEQASSPTSNYLENLHETFRCYILKTSNKYVNGVLDKSDSAT